MKKRACGFFRGLGVAAIAVAVVGGLGLFVMLLWNWLMPEIFGLSVIGYWQGLGLALLGRLLFGHNFGSKEGKKKPKAHREKCGHIFNSKYDLAYEQWWENEGEKQFDDYMNKSKQDAE